MKRVYQSIAFILFLLLACLADSFGQVSYKVVHKIYDYSTQQYKVDFDVDKEIYVEYDNLKFTFYQQPNTNSIHILKKLSYDDKQNIQVTTYEAYWNLTNEKCYFTIGTGSLITSYTIYYNDNGIKKSLAFYFRK
jgi:glucan biosynthesis protein